MQNYVVGNFGNAYLYDGEALDVMVVGDVDIVLPNKNVRTLHKVKHIPEVKKNLIFVRQLDDCGHSMVFSGGMWKITREVMVLARG